MTTYVLSSISGYPRFTVQPEDARVQNGGSSAEFKCKVKGYPKPHISWKKDGLVICFKLQPSSNTILFLFMREKRNFKNLWQIRKNIFSNKG